MGVLRDFFGLAPDTKTAPDESFNQIVGEAKKSGYKLRFFVALVPDPIDSYPPFIFDTALDAIQRGFGSALYQPDRIWIPGALETGKSQGTEDRLYRAAPGVLLFRRAGSEQPAVVFLVGESPKTGIQKRAFDVALRITSGLRKTVASPLPPPPNPTVGILVVVLRVRGFPGSRHRGVESRPPPQDLDFKIASGSATARGLEARLAKFCRTVVSDEQLQEEGFRFLEEKMDGMAIVWLS